MVTPICETSSNLYPTKNHYVQVNTIRLQNNGTSRPEKLRDTTYLVSYRVKVVSM